MKLGEDEQNTGTPPESIPLESTSDSNVPTSEKQENGRKFPGRPRKRKRGSFRGIPRKEKVITGNSQVNSNEATLLNGSSSDIKNSLSISLAKKGPFRSIYNERKDISTNTPKNCFEIAVTTGSLKGPLVNSSFSSQILPKIIIKEEKPWEEEYNYFGSSSCNSSNFSSKDNTKMQIEINDVRSVPSTSSSSDGKVDIVKEKKAGSLSKPLKIEPREEIFGKLVACEMSDLCGNPDLYLKTKQAILNLLVQARFDQMKQNAEIL